MTEYSGTIIQGGVAQQIAPANGYRTRLLYQNNSLGLMKFSATTSQVASSTVGLNVMPGKFVFPGAQLDPAPGSGPSADLGVPNGAITVWGATTGQTYFVEEG